MTPMTAQALHLLVQLHYIGDFDVHTAQTREAANLLMRMGLIEFVDPAAPGIGYNITPKGRTHVKTLLAVPLPRPDQSPPNAPGEPEPRYVWTYYPEGEVKEPQEPQTASEAVLNHTQDPLVLAMFDALTWDQQRRTLGRLGWRIAP